MVRRISEFLFQEGYRFCKVKPEQVGVFYKYVQEGFHIVMLLDRTRGYTISPEQHRHIQNQIMDLFFRPQGRLQDFPEGYPVYHVETITILIGENDTYARTICNNEKNVWIYEPVEQRLIIYENQLGEFYGIRKGIENLTNSGYKQKEHDMRENHVRESGINIRTKIKQMRKGPVVTIGLVAINVIVYIVLLLLGNIESASFMAEHGAMYPDFILEENQWWRIITAMFLHFGASHLVNNMITLGYIGSRVECEIGHVRMLLIYFLSGIGGGLLSYHMMLYTGDYAVAAGASGAIFGILGTMLWLVILNKGNLQGVTTKRMILMLVLSLYYGFATVGVDNFAHIGGAITGFLFAIILFHRKYQKY